MACEYKNLVVKTIANIGINGCYSIMGGNKRHLDLKFGMNKNKIHDIWNVICKDECTIVQTNRALLANVEYNLIICSAAPFSLFLFSLIPRATHSTGLKYW